MSPTLAQLGAAGRKAAELNNWGSVSACANELLKRDGVNPEGYFLYGLVEKAARRPPSAAIAFERVLSLDATRYDAAVELANQYALLQRHAEAKALLEAYETGLSNSPLYLNMAGMTYSMMGLHERAWPLHRKACDLQRGVDQLQANLAASGVYVGRIDEARGIYQALLKRHPTHQRYHYQLARLDRATDALHLEQMKSVLDSTRLPAEKNIFLYYAIGKELEDLERWDEAFQYYQLAGDTITKMANYDVSHDLRLIDKIIDVCDADWLAANARTEVGDDKTPIFVVGLPRTGTTLTERIISSHSQVTSLGETRFMQMALHRQSRHPAADGMTPTVIEAASKVDIRLVAHTYLDAVRYRLGGESMFIDKLPENFLYLGFIAKAFADARIVHMRRNPMDACFAMYKQSFFKFAYSLENVGRYYVAYAKLLEHWRHVLGSRLIEVEYEALVANQELQTRALLGRLGLHFETACLAFDQNEAPTATASSVQVREGMHSRSIGRWKHFSKQLQPLKFQLQHAGIEVGGA